MSGATHPAHVHYFTISARTFCFFTLTLSQVARLEPETVAAARAALQPLQAALDQVLHEQKAFNATAGSRGDGGRGDGGPSEEARAVLALFRRTQAVDEFGPLLPALVARLRSLQV